MRRAHLRFAPDVVSAAANLHEQFRRSGTSGHGFLQNPGRTVLVIYDDISLPCGKLRIRPSGSAGGHNGIKSIIEHTGSNKFPRIKVGVGEKPHPEMDLADWVLSGFSQEERGVLFEKFDKVYEAAALIADGKVSDAMNRYNG